MATIQVETDVTQHNNAVLSAMMERILVNSPVMPFGMGSSVFTDATGKFTYPDEQITETTGVLNANYTAASGLVVLVSTAMITAGDQIHIANHKDTNFVQCIFSVTSVTNATNLAVTVIGAGADTSHTTATGTKVSLHNSYEDNRKPTSTEAMGSIVEPTLISQYMQRFEENWELGQALQDTIKAKMIQGMESLTDAEAKARMEALYRLSFKIYRAMYQGIATAATTTRGGYMGGVFQRVNTNTAVNRINAGGNPLVEDDLNDLLELLAIQGLLTGEEMILRMSAKNARVLSALKAAKIQYPDNEANGVFGGSVQAYMGELPGYPGLRIIVDLNAEDSFVLMLSVNRIKQHAQAGRPLVEEVDATVPGQYGVRKILRSNITNTIVGALNYHGVIYNITP